MKCFLRIIISDEKKLEFNFFPSDDGILLDIDELSFIIKTANEFLPKAIKDEDDFDKWNDRQS